MLLLDGNSVSVTQHIVRGAALRLCWGQPVRNERQGGSRRALAHRFRFAPAYA